jgi:hypothetical protein
MTTQDYRRVLDAIDNGEPVQWRKKNSSGEWLSWHPDPAYIVFHQDCEYKPQTHSSFYDWWKSLKIPETGPGNGSIRMVGSHIIGISSSELIWNKAVELTSQEPPLS